APMPALAQDAPAATSPAAPPEPAPAEVAAAAETPAPASAAAVEAPGAGSAPMPGWIRIDSDMGGTPQLWGGGTYPLTEGIGLAFDMYLAPGLGEIDVGPAIAAGPVIITPMLGMQFDWGAHAASALVPQLYVTGGAGPVYGELWLQYYINKMFDVFPSNALYGRLFVDFKLNDYIAVGPELDFAHDSEADLQSLAIGPNIMLSNVGLNSTFMVFLGYETQDTYNDNHVAGRLTFIHNF
ncbi:MAG TPA: hypothetical protein VIW29_20325, partial [Polyangiaceae bacterium]